MNPITINHFSRRREFIQMLRERGAKIGAEIGTDHGQYAQQICEGIPGVRLICVDPWTPYTEGTEIHDQANVDQIYNEAKDRLTKYDTKIMKMTSIEAVNHIEDNSLDFVFIDGNHSYKNVLEDITEWTKKVKPGGIVAGHDYKPDPTRDYGVVEAVQEYTSTNHICPWFVLHAGGRLVDCWMFIKQ